MRSPRPAQDQRPPGTPAAGTVALVGPRLSWSLWLLLVATVVPVTQAQGLWGLGIGAALLAGLGLWWTHRRGRPILGQLSVAAIAMVLAALAALVSLDAGLIGVYAVADWLIAVAVLKSWQMAGSRDCAHVLIVCSLLLVVGAMVSGQLHYAISLLVALAVGPMVLIQWHLLAESERLALLRPETAPGTVTPRRQAGSLGWVSAAAAAFCVGVGFVIFATFPRLRTPLQPNLRGATQAVTGFSTESRLNEILQLQESDRVYMRVRLTIGDQPIGTTSIQPYFRGMTYNRYTGHSWEDERAELVSCELARDASLTYFRQLSRPSHEGEVKQEYWILAGPPPRLFSLAQSAPVAIGSQEILQVYWNSGDDTLIPPERLPTTVHYTILSVPSFVLDRSAAPPASVPATSARRPHGRVRPSSGPAVESRVVELARALAFEATGDAEDPAGDPSMHERIVMRFMRHLAAPPFVYSLRGSGPRGGHGALERFLFQTHQGYCEYYATALAVLCQCVGIPARYVTGFHGGLYNDVGHFYVVRDSDAHSWVEVWLPEAGWRTFDPTPAAESDYRSSSLRGRLASLLDYLQFQWSSWVVAYDILHRRSLFGTFGNWLQEPTLSGREQSLTRFLWTFRQLLVGPETLNPLGRLLYWLGLLWVLAMSGYLVTQLLRHLGWLLRQRRRWRRAHPGGVRFYRQVIAALARRGFTRRPAETPREFAQRVEQALPRMEGLFLQLIENYYAVRFGQADQGREDLQLSRRVLAQLRRTGPPAGRAERGR